MERAHPPSPSAPVDDRGYLPFMAGGILMAVGFGFTLAIYVPFAAAGLVAGGEIVPFLVQAHGAVQLQGWAGLFVAGMAFRLAPRLAGRRPVDARLSSTVFLLLAFGVLGRFFGQSVERLTWLCAPAGLAGGVGMGLMAIVLGWYLVRTRRPGAWTLGFAAGASWWLWWGGVTAWSGLRLAETRYLAFFENEPILWTAMLGAIGNFIAGVQARSVPTFFGRRPPSARRFALPWVFLNLGLGLVALQLLEPFRSPRLEGAGFALAGSGVCGLVLTVGAFHARAHRLRPRARPAARYVAAGNWAGVAAGLLLLWVGVEEAMRGAYAAAGLRDAARHLFAVGTITMLIVGVAQLIAPVFALSRAEPRRLGISDHAAYWALVVAVLLRAGAGLVQPWVAYDQRMALAGVAGVLGWYGVAFFAWRAAWAIRNERRMIELLAQGVPH